MILIVKNEFFANTAFQRTSLFHTGNLEITINKPSLFKKFFKPNQFNITMKKSAIAISSIKLLEFWISVWEVCSIPGLDAHLM